MCAEFLKFFEGRSLNIFFEGTLGAGGHAEALLKAHPEVERYLTCDLDPEAIALAKEAVAPWGKKVEIIHGNFADLDQVLKKRAIQHVDGFFLILEFHQCNSIKGRGGLVL
jgi:16S rRNA (cytosine1402-N4)-methyltransferase